MSKTLKLPIPVIVLTNDVSTVNVEKCKTVGVKDYLVKPVDEELLYSKKNRLFKKIAIIKSDDVEHNVTETVKFINLDYLHKLTKSNPKLIKEMITLYLEQTPPLINLIKQSLLHKDWDLLQSAAHKIIPSFSIVGINSDFEKMAKKIQNYKGVKKQTNAMQKMVLQLENVCTQACKELEEELDKIKNTK